MIAQLACAFGVMVWPSVRPPDCQYYSPIAKNADVVGRIPASRQVLVPAGRSGAMACLPVFAAPIQPQGQTTALRSSSISVRKVKRVDEKRRKSLLKCQCAPIPTGWGERGKKEKVRWAWLYHIHLTMRLRLDPLWPPPLLPSSHPPWRAT